MNAPQILAALRRHLFAVSDGFLIPCAKDMSAAWQQIALAVGAAPVDTQAVLNRVASRLGFAPRSLVDPVFDEPDGFNRHLLELTTSPGEEQHEPLSLYQRVANVCTALAEEYDVNAGLPHTALLLLREAMPVLKADAEEEFGNWLVSTFQHGHVDEAAVVCPSGEYESSDAFCRRALQLALDRGAFAVTPPTAGVVGTAAAMRAFLAPLAQILAQGISAYRDQAIKEREASMARDLLSGQDLPSDAAQLEFGLAMSLTNIKSTLDNFLPPIGQVDSEPELFDHDAHVKNLESASDALYSSGEDATEKRSLAAACGRAAAIHRQFRSRIAHAQQAQQRLERLLGRLDPSLIHPDLARTIEREVRRSRDLLRSYVTQPNAPWITPAPVMFPILKEE